MVVVVRVAVAVRMVVPVVMAAVVAAMLAVLMVMIVVMIVVMIMVVGAQEFRVDLQLGVQVEAAQVEDGVDRRLAEVDQADRRARVHVQQAVAQIGHVGFGHQVGLGDEDGVGKAYLTLRLFLLVQLQVGVLGVDQRDHRVEQVARGNFLVHEEGLRHRARVGHAGGLDHHAVEADLAGVAARQQRRQRLHQVAADGAADAAVAHLHDLLAAVLHQDLVVDVLFAELVLDDGNLHAVLLVQDALEQGGLAAAEEAGQDRDRGQFGHLLFSGK
ncbi:hypothetical protein D9M72_504060 [compost metagenome]